MRKNYELTVIFKENESEKKEGMTQLEELFSKHDVKVQTKSEVGLRVLAYDIQDYKKGFYMFYIINADNMKIDKLSADMRLSTSFLRFLIVRKDELTSGQKARKESKLAKIREHLAKKSQNSQDETENQSVAAENTSGV